MLPRGNRGLHSISPLLQDSYSWSSTGRKGAIVRNVLGYGNSAATTNIRVIPLIGYNNIVSENLSRIGFVGSMGVVICITSWRRPHTHRHTTS